jgi:NAD(P)-dependent dehydrogenase (short-subunit alcohol dehydrogenase family)
MRLLGKNILVTGGSTGIGEAVARRFVQEGANVIISGRDPERLEEAARLIAAGTAGAAGASGASAPSGPASAAAPTAAPATPTARASEVGTAAGVGGGEVATVAGDVQFAQDSARMLDAVLSRWGRIDVLVNNAGICQPANFLDLTEDEWDRHLDINLKGTFLIGQLTARQMVKQQSGGSIINMSSVNGLAAEAHQAHYNASKGGINLLTMSMAIELAPYGIRANALCPGFIDTRLTRPLIDRPEAIGDYLRTIPMGRVGEPKEIASAALFLASDDSAYMTGHCMVVDGGQLIKLS